MTYNTITDIRNANKAIGHHWFEPGTMRFFQSRIASGVLGGRYFVTSEKDGCSNPRRYTVRVADNVGRIDTVGDFQQFETLTAARVWLWETILRDREGA